MWPIRTGRNKRYTEQSEKLHLRQQVYSAFDILPFDIFKASLSELKSGRLEELYTFTQQV